MTSSSSFDLAKAVQRARQEHTAEESKKEAEKKRAQEQWNQKRANALKLLRYAEDQLEKIRNPVVSEFVVVERREHLVGLFKKRSEYSERQTRYYGSWLSLHIRPGSTADIDYIIASRVVGMVKLNAPRAGYAYVDTYDLPDPRLVNLSEVKITTNFDSHGRERIYDHHREWFRVFASLEETVGGGTYLSAESVARALNLSATD